MREQGIAANATPRAIRGKTRENMGGEIFKAQRYGNSAAIRDRVIGIAKSCRVRGDRGSGARRLLETRKSPVSSWMKAAEVLDEQGEVTPHNGGAIHRITQRGVWSNRTEPSQRSPQGP